MEFLLFTAGWGANHFSTLLVVYRRDLGLSPAALGILFAAYALGLVPGLMFAGRASDGWGRRAIVLPSSALAIAASAVLAFGAHGFGVLFAGRLLFGLAMGSIMSPGSVWVQELSSTQIGARGATLALSAGFGLGPLATSLIAEFAPAPMVVPYLLHALVMAMALAGVRSVPNTLATVAGGAVAVGVSARRPGIGRHEFGVLAQLLPVAPWVFAFPTVTLAILPGLMRPHVARPILYSGFVIVTTLLSAVLVQSLVKRIGPRADRLGLAIGAVGLLLASYAVAIGSPALVFVVGLLVGAAYGLTMTTGLLEVSERISKQTRGTTVGLYYVLTYVGFALPFIHATLAKHLGNQNALLAAAAVVPVCLLMRAVIVARVGSRRGADGQP